MLFVNFRTKYCTTLLFLLILSLAFTTKAQLNTAYYLEKGQQEIQKNNYTEAISIFNKVIEVSRENHLAYFFRGFSKMQLGDFLGAESDFTQTVTIHHGYSAGYYYLGVIKAEKKDYYDALKNLDKAIEINATNSDYFNARGYVKTMIWDTLGAYEDLSTSIRMNSSNVNAYYNRSVLWLNTKKYEKALEDCNKAIDMKPVFYELYLLRGHIKIVMQDTLGAKNDFEFIIGKDSGNIAAYYNLALYYHDKKDYKKALSHYTKVIELNPYNSECYFNRAALYAENEHFTEASADYTNVIRLNPKNLFAYFYRAEIRQQQHDLGGAIDDYSTVISLFPMFYHAYYMRSMLYRELNNYQAYLSDKKMAEQLMNSSDSTLYSEEQTASFKRLFEFRTEVENADTSSGKIQYKSYEIIIKPLYHLTISESSETNTPANFNAQLASINPIGGAIYKLEFSHQNNQLSAEKLIEERNRVDTITSENNSERLIIWRSLVSGLLYNYDEALQLINKINDTSAFAYLAWFIKGNIHFDLGQNHDAGQKSYPLLPGNDPLDNNDYYYQAIEDYSAAITKNARFSYAYFNRAYVKGILNEFSSAILDYSVCIFYNNSFAEAYFNRGLLYLYLGNEEKGCEDISKAGELGIKESYNVLYKYCKK
ncbi:MAG TPA: tetratricopeptide repeat protein [Bacteroidales bacterium]|nr:tetratricopeptide repeat protein [Bacteroidales bacterium]